MRFYKKHYLLLYFIIVACPFLGNCSEGDKNLTTKIKTRSWEAMGTVIHISLCEKDRKKQDALFEEIASRINYLETIMSSHLPDSELNKLNRLAVAQKIGISGELWDAINAGKAWYSGTLGVFDITAGPLIKMWRYAGKTQQVPSNAEIASALQKTGIDKIVLEPSGFHVMKTGDVYIDLGGLGKGFTADKIIDLARRHGEVSALVAMSGDIRALGNRPDGRPWKVGIQDPRFPENLNALVTVVEIMDMAVSTSGNYRRYVEINGRHYSHIVDPRTGLTAERVPSVSVIGPDALTTDIMGTALSVLGVTEGLKLVESMKGVEALFMEVDDAGELILTRSSSFRQYEAHDKTDTQTQK